MPEGLSDQDRAKIESARQSASGCLNVVAFIAFAFAALIIALIVFIAANFSGENRFILFLGGLAVLCLLAGFGFRFIAKQ